MLATLNKINYRFRVVEAPLYKDLSIKAKNLIEFLNILIKAKMDSDPFS